MDYMSFGKLKMLTDTIKVDGHDSNYKIYSQTHLRPPLNLPQNLKNMSTPAPRPKKCIPKPAPVPKKIN